MKLSFLTSLIYNDKVPKNGDFVEAKTNGVKTWGQVLSELYSQMDVQKITNFSRMVWISGNGKNIYPLVSIAIYQTSFEAHYIVPGVSNNSTVADRFVIRAAATRDHYENNTYTNYVNTVATNGFTLRIYY